MIYALDKLNTLHVIRVEFSSPNHQEIKARSPLPIDVSGGNIGMTLNLDSLHPSRGVLWWHPV